MLKWFTGAAGQTRAEMDRLLPPSTFSREIPAVSREPNSRAPSRSSSPVGNGKDLLSANALFVDTTFPLLNSYKSTLSHQFNATVAQADFQNDPQAARKAINQFTASTTGGEIADLIGAQSLDRSTRAVLVSALYMKAAWKESFNPADTRREPFKLASGRVKVVPLMQRNSSQTLRYVDSRTLGAQLVELPFDSTVSGGNLTMVVVLPHNGNGLVRLEQKLTAPAIDAALSSAGNRKVSLFLPRFTVSWNGELKEHLRRLGLVSAFSDNLASFPGISEQHLVISQVAHKVIFGEYFRARLKAHYSSVPLRLMDLLTKDPTVSDFLQIHHFFLFYLGLQRSRKKERKALLALQHRCGWDPRCQNYLHPSVFRLFCCLCIC